MKLKHRSFWDYVDAFIIEAHDECSRMVEVGKFDEFAAAWLDPVVRLSERRWFADAKPVARKIAQTSVRRQIGNMIGYYHQAEKLLG